jgi:hypothetical protein
MNKLFYFKEKIQKLIITNIKEFSTTKQIFNVKKYLTKNKRITKRLKNRIVLEKHNFDNVKAEDINLQNLRDNPGSKLKYKRIGRGIGSGKGRLSGRGNMGQRSRSSVNIPAGFEGGQTKLYLRTPKFGFTNKRFFSF